MSLRLNNRHLAVLGIIILAVIAARLILADTGTNAPYIQLLACQKS